MRRADRSIFSVFEVGSVFRSIERTGPSILFAFDVWRSVGYSKFDDVTALKKVTANLN